MNVLTANRTGINMAFKAATGLFVALLLTLGLLAGQRLRRDDPHAR